jgi:hypothetical protein
LTIEVSISSITEARMTVIVISHLLAPRSDMSLRLPSLSPGSRSR